MVCRTRGSLSPHRTLGGSRRHYKSMFMLTVEMGEDPDQEVATEEGEEGVEDKPIEREHFQKKSMEVCCKILL